VNAARVSLREELIFLLNEATELEHSLCCSYLFMGFSLKSTIAEGLTEESVGAVRRWKRTFNDVAIQEMFHLALINNLLIAVGSAPNLDRPNFPHGCDYYMPNVSIELQPFGEPQLRHFIAVEQPKGSTLPFQTNPALAAGVQGDLDNEIGPDPYHLDSQGDVYGLVLDGLRDMVARLGEENVFIGPPATEALRRFLESNGWEPIQSLATAEKALSRIVEEGEGGSGDSSDSHHHRFTSVLDEYLALKQGDPSFEPAFPVLSNPFARTPPEANGAVNLIDDEFAIQVSDLFNEVYTAMLQLIARFFVTTDETEQEASRLADAAIEAMAGAVMPLGELLVRLPAGTNNPNMTAGPSFVVRTLHPLPYKNAAWKLLQERFTELRDYTGQLAVSNPSQGSLVDVGEVLSRVAKMLG
jgi:Ferritin-like